MEVDYPVRDGDGVALLPQRRSGRHPQSNIDAAGRLEISQNTSTGDYVLARNDLPLLIDKETGGAGTALYNAALNAIDLAVSGIGDFAILQTKQHHPYYPGRAQQPEMTHINFAPEEGVTKRIGYFSSNTVTPFDSNKDGVYLQSKDGAVDMIVSKNGSPHVVPEAEWLRTDIDWTKFQITMFDFLYLGGSTIDLYQIHTGGRHHAALHHHANKMADTLFGHPAQPVRAEIRSPGGAGSFSFVCANVGTLGGVGDNFGVPASLDTGEAFIALSTANQPFALLAVRETDPTAEFFIHNLEITSTGSVNDVFRWRLLMNPTVDTAFVFSPISDTFLELALRAASGTLHKVTDEGHVLASGSGVARAGDGADISDALRLGRSIAGVFDVMVLEITLLTSNQSFHASINGVVV